MAPFLIIWVGQAISLLGSQLVQFALIWYITETTGSATVLATASLVGLLPKVFLGPIIGVLIDRWNRKQILIFSDAAIAGVTVILAILFAINDVQLWQAITPPEMQGRLFSIGGSLVNTVIPIGLAIAGPVADTVSVQFWFLIGGIFTAILGILPFFVPAIINIENARNGQNSVESSHIID